MLRLLPFFLGGCATIYIPPPGHIPLLDEAGDMQVSGYAGVVDQAGVSAAYAVSDAVSLRSRGYLNSVRTDYPSYLAELGVGYTKSTYLEPDVSQRGGRFGVSLDVGKGLVQDRFDAWITPVESGAFYKADISYLHLQIFAAYEGNHVAAGIALRDSIHRHRLRPETDMSAQPPAVATYSWLEPMGFLRLGARGLYVEGQIGISEALTDLPTDTSYFPSFATLGLGGEFNVRNTD